MKYHHLVDKLDAYDKKIHERMEEAEKSEQLPGDLIEKAKGARTWLDSQRGRELGNYEVPSMAPDIDPMLDYATALNTYQNLFDEKGRSEIDEFEELVRELFQMVKAPTPDVD